MDNAVDAEWIENSIISEIRRLQAQSKRADFTSVSHAAESRYGLANSVSKFYLKQIATKVKVKVALRGGAESFRIIDKDMNTENKMTKMMEHQNE